VLGPPGIREYITLLRKLKILYLSYPLDVREFGAASFRNGTDPDRPALRPPTEPQVRLQPIQVYESAKYIVSALPLDHRVFTLGYRIEERPRPGKFNLERALEIGVPEGPLFGRLQGGQDIVLADGRTVRSSDVLGPPRLGRTLAYCTDTRPCQA